MSKSDPYKDSPYDAAGMPLGTELVDYDKDREQRRFATVRQVIPLEEENQITLVDVEFEEPKLPNKITHKNIDKSRFNSAIKEGVNVPGADQIDVVDVEDPAVRKELLVKEAEDKGFKEVQELPKTEDKESVEDVKKKAVEKSDEDDFESLVNADKTTPGEAPKDDSKDAKK